MLLKPVRVKGLQNQHRSLGLQLGWNRIACLQVKNTKYAKSWLVAFTEPRAPQTILMNIPSDISIFAGFDRWGILHKLLCACTFLECDAVFFFLPCHLFHLTFSLAAQLVCFVKIPFLRRERYFLFKLLANRSFSNAYGPEESCTRSF